MTDPEQMDTNQQLNIEGEPVSGNLELDPNKISFQEVDGTLDALMVKFTKDENYKEVIDARRGIVTEPEKEQDTKVEKGKRGNVRGALIPIAATGAGIGAGYLFSSNVYKIGKTASEITGFASPVFNTLSVLEKFSPPVIATLGSGISSLTASAIRRSFGENVFDYYSRYSHFDAQGNFVTKPLKKIYNWYTRGLEHEAFNAFVLNPAEPADKVHELLETSADPEFDKKFAELDNNRVENLVAKGYMHLVSTDATEYYGAEFSPEDRQKADEYRVAVKSAIDKFKNKIPEAQKGEFEQNVFNKVVNEEKMRYLLATGLTATASGLKAFAFGSVYETIHDWILPKFFPELARQPQTVQVPVEESVKVNVTNPATQPEGVGIPQSVGKDIPNAIPKPGVVENPVPTADVLRPGYGDMPKGIEEGIETTKTFIPTEGQVTERIVENPVPTADILRPGNFNPAAEIAKPVISIPEVTAPEIGITNPNPITEGLPSIGSSEVIEGSTTVPSGVETTVPMVTVIPKVESTEVTSALETLPTISASGVIEGSSTAESLLTFEEGLNMLSIANSENPEAVQQAIEAVSASPDIGQEAADLFGTLGTAAPEVIRGLQASGPTGLYILNKILQLLACGGSLSTGGMACPALAGP